MLQISVNKSIAVSFIVYEKATLFPSSNLANKSQDEGVQRIVASHVISATVEGIEVKNLTEDNLVEILFVLNKVSLAVINRVHRARCQSLPEKIGKKQTITRYVTFFGVDYHMRTNNSSAEPDSIEYLSDDVTKTFLFAFQRFEYQISVERDEKPPKPKWWESVHRGLRYGSMNT